MSTTQAEEAIARAKAIAARLAGTSVPQAAATPSITINGSPSGSGGLDAAAQAALDAAFGAAATPTTKRKRWGSNGEENAIADAVAAAMSDTTDKRAKTDAASKKVWIPVDRNPGYNYIGLLIGPGGSKQRELVAESGGQVKISIRGRGSNDGSSSAVPGAPEEPLHVLLEGSQECVDRAEKLVSELLNDTEKADEEKNRQLAQVNASKGGTASSAASTYKPTPVAQLLGLGGAGAGHYGPAPGGESVEEIIGVPNGVVGFIIGKGGESISNMQRLTGCRVQIQKEHEMPPGSTQREITLTASTQESISQCRSIIEQMVQERTLMGGGGAPQQHVAIGGGTSAVAQAAQLQNALAEGQALVKVQVPNADVGLIIGKSGATIRSIQDRSGANIQIPQGPDPDNPMVRTVSVTHPNQGGAEFAKTLIEEVLKTKFGDDRGGMGGISGGGDGGRPNPGESSLQVQIPDRDVGMCIGKGGCVIREMQNKTRTRIQIPSHPTPGSLYRIATVTGPAEGCQQVQEMVNRISMEQSSQFVMTGVAFQGNALQPQQYGHYGQQAHLATGAYGHYSQQQQPGAYGTPVFGAYGAQPASASTYGQSNQQTAAGQKSDYSAEWAAYYAAQAAQKSGAAAAPAPASQSGDQPAPDAYYDVFFQYSYHYGEDAARKYYGAWSPPPGTPNPYGTNPKGISGAAPQQQSTTNQSSAPAPAPTTHAVKDTSVRNVSNLPAWMTKG